MADLTASASPGPAGARWRAAAMLFCLFGLPLAALRGTSWTELAKTVAEISKGIVSGYFGESPVLARESPHNPLQRLASECPSPRVIAPSRHPSEGLGSASGLSVSDADPQMDRQGGGADSRHDQRPTRPAAMKDWTSGPVSGVPTDPPSRRSEISPRDYSPLVSMAWHDRKRKANQEAPPLQDAVIRPEAAAADASGDFQQILERLRALGAVHYMLETWGNDAQRFRFHCKMALRSNPNYIRHFEAIDRDAFRAMSQVLAEVEAWRNEQ